MRLTEPEYYSFLDAHQSLILYAAQKKKIINSQVTLEQFRMAMTAEEAVECRSYQKN